MDDAEDLDEAAGLYRNRKNSESELPGDLEASAGDVNYLPVSTKVRRCDDFYARNLALLSSIAVSHHLAGDLITETAVLRGLILSLYDFDRFYDVISARCIAFNPLPSPSPGKKRQKEQKARSNSLTKHRNTFLPKTPITYDRWRIDPSRDSPTCVVRTSDSPTTSLTDTTSGSDTTHDDSDSSDDMLPRSYSGPPFSGSPTGEPERQDWMLDGAPTPPTLPPRDKTLRRPMSVPEGPRIGNRGRYAFTTISPTSDYEEGGVFDSLVPTVHVSQHFDRDDETDGPGFMAGNANERKPPPVGPKPSQQQDVAGSTNAVPRYLGDKEYHCLSDGEDLAPTLPPRGKVRRRSRSADFARVSCRGRHAFTSVSPSPSRSDLDMSEWEVPEEDEINAVCASDMTKLDNLSVSCGKVYTNRGRIVSTFANKVRKPKAGPEPALQQDESQAWPDFRSSDKDQPPSKLRLHRQLYSQDTLLKMRPVGQQDDIEVNKVYRFVVRIMLSCVGPTPDGPGMDTFHLLRHLRLVFRIPKETHIALVNDENKYACKMSDLVVDVIEARHLAAMDPNGFSDPYVMLAMEGPRDHAKENFDTILKATHHQNHPEHHHHEHHDHQHHHHRHHRIGSFGHKKRGRSKSPHRNKKKKGRHDSEADTSPHPDQKHHDDDHHDDPENHHDNQQNHHHDGHHHKHKGRHGVHHEDHHHDHHDDHHDHHAHHDHHHPQHHHSQVDTLDSFHTTKVVYRSLSPQWNQQFKLPVRFPDDNTLLVFVVDKDEGGAELPKLSGHGLKALSNIVQSVRSMVKEGKDDFMGSVSIPLKSIPPRGERKWYKLKDMDQISSTKGEILLNISFTSESVAEPTNEVPNRDLVGQVLKSMFYHEVLVYHDMNEDQIERNVSPNRSRSPSVLSGRHPSDRSLSDSTVDGSTAFSTLLSQQDDYIVNQIQLQLGLSDANIEVMKWLALNSLFKNDLLPFVRDVGFGLMVSMRNLRTHAKEMDLIDGGLLKELMDSLHFTLDVMLTMAQQSGELFPPQSNNLDLTEILRAAKSIYTQPLFIQFHHDKEEFGEKSIVDAVQSAVEEFYNQFGMPRDFNISRWSMPNDASSESVLKSRRPSGVAVNPEVYTAHAHDNEPLFRWTKQTREGPVGFFKARSRLLEELVQTFDNKLPAYKYYQSLFKKVNLDYIATVTSTLAAKFSEEVNVLTVIATKHLHRQSGEDTDSRVAIAQTLLQLFVTAKKMRETVKNTHGVSLDTIPVFEMFQPVLPYMLNSWRSIALRQVTRAIQLDPMTQSEKGELHSHSAVDVCLIFNRLKNEWEVLADWPDQTTRFTTMICIISVICDGALSYAVLAHKRIKKRQSAESMHDFCVETLEETAILQNNINYVLERLVLKLPDWFSKHIFSASFSDFSEKLDLSQHIQKMATEDVDSLSGEKYKETRASLKTVCRLVQSTESHMGDCIRPVFSSVLQGIQHEVHGLLKENRVEETIVFALHTLLKVCSLRALQVSLRRRIALDIWSRVLQVVQTTVDGRIRDNEFYRKCLRHLNDCSLTLVEKTEVLERKDLDSDLFQTLKESLHMHCQDDSMLFQLYFDSLAQEKSANSPWGSVSMQLGQLPNRADMQMSNIRVNLLHYRGLYVTAYESDEYPVYFQCQLLPNEVVGCDQVVKSKFCQGTDDFMDVVLTLPVPRHLTTRAGCVVRFSALHKRRIGGDELLGEVIVPLTDIKEMDFEQFRHSPQLTFELRMFRLAENRIVQCLQKRSATSPSTKKFLAVQKQWLKAAESVLSHRDGGTAFMA